MSRLEGSHWRLRRARETQLAFEWLFFGLLFGAKVNAGISKAAENRRKYHLIRGGLSHAQRSPRQRLSPSRQSGSWAETVFKPSKPTYGPHSITR